MRINGARIHCEREGDGPPVVFLHAGIADMRMWDPQVAAFATQFDVIRLDQRGFGESELPAKAWSPVADLLSLMDQLSLDTADLVGCSMGGALAIDFTLAHPDRVSKLVLVGSAIGGFAFRPEHAHLFAEVASARKAGDLMPKILTDLRMDRRRAEAEVLKVWNNLIDPAISAHAQPTGLNKGTLFVTVDSSVWLDEIVRYRQ